MIRIEGEVHSSKNSHRIFKDKKNGSPFIVKSKASKADESSFALQLNCQRGTWLEMTKGRSYPLYVMFNFIRRTKARWDFANLVQGVADAMVRAGYIPDDDVSHFIPVWGGYDVNKDAPGVEFWIE